MKDVILKNKDLQINEWKKKIGDSSSLHLLQERLDLAEKNQEKPFCGFFGCGNDSVVFISERTFESAA